MDNIPVEDGVIVVSEPVADPVPDPDPAEIDVHGVL